MVRRQERYTAKRGLYLQKPLNTSYDLDRILLWGKDQSEGLFDIILNIVICLFYVSVVILTDSYLSGLL